MTLALPKLAARLLLIFWGGQMAYASPAGDLWFSTMAKTYTESNVKDDGDGVSSSIACFDTGMKAKGERCTKLAFVVHDSFLQQRIFTPPQTQWFSRGGHPYLRSVIGVKACQKPVYLLRPYYFSKQDWLFMQQVDVMLNGAVLLSKSFSFDQVQRETHEYGVEERLSLAADDGDLDALRKIAQGGKVQIRITGKNAYIPVSQELAAKFNEDVADALRVYDRLNSQITSQAEAACRNP